MKIKNYIANLTILAFIGYSLYWIITDGICMIMDKLSRSREICCKNPFCKNKTACDISSYFVCSDSEFEN